MEASLHTLSALPEPADSELPAMRFQLDQVQVDLERRTLSCSNRCESVTPKAMHVMRELIMAAPQPVRRDDLLDAVWPEADVNEAIVTDAVRSLRRALEGIGARKSLLRTIPKLGYALDAHPVPLKGVAESPQVPATAGRLTESVHNASESGPDWWLPLKLCLVAAIACAWIALFVMPGAPESGSGNPYLTQARKLYELYRPQDNQRAIDILERGLAEQPEQPALLAALAEAQAQQYGAFGLDHSWAERALETARRATKLDPNSSSAHRALGLANAVLGRHEPSMIHYRRAIELDPNNRQALGNLGYRYLIAQRPDQALPLFERGAELAPSGDPRASMFLAMTYAQLGADEVAQAYFEAAERLSLSEPEDRREYVEYLAKRGHASAAEQRLAELQPHMASADWLRLGGNVAAWTNQEAVALERFSSFLSDAGPDDPWLNYVRARQAALSDSGYDSALCAPVVEALGQAIVQGPQPFLPGDRHEVAIRLLSCNRVDESILWLDAAVQAGWIDVAGTRSEPAMRRALSDGHPEIGRLVALMTRRQALRRSLVRVPQS